MNQKTTGPPEPPKKRRWWMKDPSRKRKWWATVLIMLFGLTVGHVYKEWRYGGWPYVTTVETARVAVVGPPATAFCPELPGGLYFGDSPQTVTARMGRPPDIERPSTENKLYLFYVLTPQYGFTGTSLYFLFIDGRLNTLGVKYYYPNKGDAQDPKGFFSAFAELESSVSITLGKPVGSPEKYVSEDKLREAGLILRKAWGVWIQ